MVTNLTTPTISGNTSNQTQKQKKTKQKKQKNQKKQKKQKKAKKAKKNPNEFRTPKAWGSHGSGLGDEGTGKSMAQIPQTRPRMPERTGRGVVAGLVPQEGYHGGHRAWGRILGLGCPSL